MLFFLLFLFITHITDDEHRQKLLVVLVLTMATH